MPLSTSLKKRPTRKPLRGTGSLSGYLEPIEPRVMFAAHIAGNTTSYATIQAAVDAASPGATINVDAGTYDETVSIYKSLTIRGAQAGVDARNTRGAESIVYATQTVFAVNTNDVTIDGFTIEGDDADIGAALGAGVLMAPSIHGTQVLDNVIQNNVTGIYLSNNSNTDQALIRHNLIQNNFEANNNWQKSPGENGSRGIYTDGTVSGGYLTDALIDANKLYNSNFNAGDEDEGMIALQALTAGKQFNIAITNNYIGNESKGILATNVTNLTVLGNTFTSLTDSSSGPVRFEGDANTVDIQYNTITGNSGPGVAADSSGVAGNSSGFVVNNNNIYGNDGIGFLTQASAYDGPVTLVGDWWGDASGPGGDGPGKGVSVWANGVSGHATTPKGLTGGGPITFSPWATSLINIVNIPAPAAASGLTITPAAASQLTLNWTAPSSTATSQVIQRSTDGVNFTTTAVVPPLLTTFTDTGLSTGVTYYYRVVTSNATGNGAASNTAVSVPPGYQPPMPVNGITLISSTGTSNNLRWNLPDYAFGISSYTVYRNGVVVGTTNTLNFTDSGLAPNTSYAYTVVTNDTTGAASAHSAVTPIVSGVSQFLDPSFEQTPAANAYDPTTANWTFTGNSAIEYSGGAFGTITVPSGSQFAVIQGYNSGTIGAISQTVAVNPAGTYTISFAAAQRAGYTVEPVTVTVDGTLISTITPTATSFATYSTTAFKLTGGSHKIVFSGSQNIGDNDSYIDAVSLNFQSPSTAPAAPVNATAAPASGTTVNVTWAPGGNYQTSFNVLRSADGNTWTTIATGLSATTTAYIDTGRSPSTAYYYAVTATNAVGTSAVSNVSQGITFNSSAAVTPIGSLAWTTATSGYKTVQKNASVLGNALTLHGVTYPGGLGTSALSIISFPLGGAYTAFTTDAGIDGEVTAPAGNAASVDFQILGDGKVLFDSGDLTINSPTVHVAVPVAGVQTLTLVATNGVTGIDYDHADWAGTQLLTNGNVPTAPAGLSAVAVSTTSIGLTWAPTTAPVTGYAVDRSTDGANFATVATGLAGTANSWTDMSVLTPGTTYSYRIRAVNGVGPSGNSAIAAAATFSTAPTPSPLSSLNWTAATAGYGAVQKNLSIGGNTLNLHGVSYTTGIGTHAASTITYTLAGKYTVFSSDVGIDSETAGSGSVDFQVQGDGKVLYDSGVLTSASPTDHFAVNVTGVQTLTLVATNGVAGSIDYDHADWAGATLLATAAAPAAPINVSAAAAGSTSITITWAAGSSNQTGFAIDRSTDGVTFTTITAGLVAGATSYADSASLGASTNYYYRVRAFNAVGASANSPVVSATTLAAASVSTPISQLTWTSATAGFGTAQKNLSIKDNTLTLHGTTYPTGLGTHAASTIVYNLAGGYTLFSSDVGIDDEEIGVGSGSVDFQVIGDGKVLFDSGILTSSSPTDHIAVSVAGVQTLSLIATNGVAGSIDYDHADWAGATLSSNPQAPAAPAGLVAVASSATRVNLRWTSAPGATAYLVQRSTDGTNFSTITTQPTAVSTGVSDTAAAAGTTYFYRVVAVNSVGNSTPSATASATTLASSAVVTNLSTLAWTSATTGYGTVQKNQTVLGNAITLRGVTYATGIGAHAVSSIVYNLNGAYTSFISDVGVDDEENGKGTGTVDFQVTGDGKVLFDSGPITNGSPVVSLNVNVAGVKTLTLTATNGVANSIDYDHADWAGAQLVATAAVPATPQSEVSPPSVISSMSVMDVAAPTVPSTWSNTLIGNVGLVGSASKAAATFTMNAAGGGVGKKSDAVDYAFQSLTGDGTIVARLQTPLTGNGQAGLLIRDSLASDAKEVGLLLGKKGVQFVQRTNTGATAGIASAVTKKAVPSFLKLVRKGNRFTAYISTDGTHWKVVKSATIKMGQTVDIGITGASGNTTNLSSAVFSQVAVTAATLQGRTPGQTGGAA